MISRAVITMAMLLFVAIPVAAQDAPRAARPVEEKMHGPPILKMLDINHDGVLSYDEVSGEYQRMLFAIDVDGDGAVSAEEFARRGSLIVGIGALTVFDLMDVNGDGKLSREEVVAPVERSFKRRNHQQ